MDNGEDGAELLAWLNGLEDAQELVKEHFEGVGINKQNLSEWRQGGFREWQLREEMLGQVEGLRESGDELAGMLEGVSLAGMLGRVLAVRYAGLLNTWNGEPDEKMEAQLRVLRGMVKDVALLQRTLERAERWQRESEREEDEMEREEFEASKQRSLNMLWSLPQRAALVKLFGGGKMGERIAEAITALENDLPIPEAPSFAKATEGGKEEGRIKKEEVQEAAREAETVKVGQTESDSVEAGQAQNLSRARRRTPLPKRSEAVKPGQGESGSVKPVEAPQGEGSQVEEAGMGD